MPLDSTIIVYLNPHYQEGHADGRHRYVVTIEPERHRFRGKPIHGIVNFGSDPLDALMHGIATFCISNTLDPSTLL